MCVVIKFNFNHILSSYREWSYMDDGVTLGVMNKSLINICRIKNFISNKFSLAGSRKYIYIFEIIKLFFIKIIIYRTMFSRPS